MQTNDFSNLPTSWQIKTLGEIYDITSSKRVFKDEWKTDGIPFYRARDLVSFSKNEPIKNPLFISETMYNEYSSKYGIPLEDDILVTGVGTIGIPYLVKANEKFYFKDGNILWFKKRASNIFSKYVYYLFLSNLLDTNSKGSTVLTYTIINAKNTKIPLPSLEIQKCIVARLERAFEKIEKGSAHLQDAKTKLAKYKQSLLKSAFDGTLFCHTEGEARSISNQESRDISLTLNMTNSPSLRESAADKAIHESKVDCYDLTSSKLAMTDKENPKLPQGWTIKTLGEIAQTTSGGTPSRKKLDYWNGNIKWLKSGELNDNYINEVEETITQSGLENSSAKIFSKGTLLIALYGATIGKLGILNLETSTNQAVCAIMPNKELETKYLFHFLFSIRNKMIKDAFGGAQSNISQTYLKQIKIPLPPLETQKQIVKLLEKHLQHADKTGEFIESALNKAKQLKQSLLKSAFLGKLT